MSRTTRNPLRVRRALGFRERNRCELELRVALGGDDLGVCDVIIDEHEHEVYVRVLVCYDPNDEERRDQELPLFTPRCVNSVVQPNHGYSPANRRHRTQ